MRFFSSSALASAPKLRFAASCSAAETMSLAFSRAPPPAAFSGPGPSADAGHYLVSGFDKSIVPKSKLPEGARAMTQMLRRFAFFLGRGQDLDRTARLFDGRNRGLGSAVHLDIQLGLELAAAEQPNATLGAANDARLDQRYRVHGFLDVDQLGIDRLLDPVEVDLGEFDAEDVVEAALGQTAMHRHLAAFETLDAHARTRGLALAAAACLLALAGTDAAADAHALFARAGVVGDIAELHRTLLIP